MSATGEVVTLPAMSRFGTLSRLGLVALAALALAASGSSKPTPPINAYNQPTGERALPTPQAMDRQAPLGLWTTNFGAVKIESDGAALHGAWSYDRDGQQVVGYFGGVLDGNLLRLTWREPAQPIPGAPQLTGEGWLAFDPSGASFAGSWWSDDGQRKGDWTGTRVAQPLPGDPAYGGQTYGAPYPPPAYPSPAPYAPPPSATSPPPDR